MSNVYDQLMPDVTDTKDLGSGVIGAPNVITSRFASRNLQIRIARFGF
jgi:hypothetical protein